MRSGERVNNFVLKDQHGENFDLYENLDRNILLVFYPKDSSPVCTKQLMDYSLNKDELEKNDIEIVGVNVESIESHSVFCQNNKINFRLLSDDKKVVSRKFNALNLLGTNKRKLVLIGKDGVIKFEKTTLPMFFADSQLILSELRKSQLI